MDVSIVAAQQFEMLNELPAPTEIPAPTNATIRLFDRRAF
jgi:hypothetical protein